MMTNMTTKRVTKSGSGLETQTGRRIAWTIAPPVRTAPVRTQDTTGLMTVTGGAS